MRPIEQKILSRISESGVSFDQILEWIESTPTPEMKKSFPDDCHFQSPRYFAKLIADSLVRQHLLQREGNLYVKPKKQNDTPSA